MKETLRRTWHFIWEDNSILSWLVNVGLAFVLIKFLVYPGLGFLLATGNPVVAVVSCSMEHTSSGCGQERAIKLCGQAQDAKRLFEFDEYWNVCGSWYEENNISKEEFSKFGFRDGFQKGDLMVLRGKKPEDVGVGDVVVFQGGEAEPIIHRVVWTRALADYHIYSTKGDNNEGQLPYEKRISGRQIIGTAFIRIPYLGWVKILFTEALQLLTKVG